MNTTKKYYTDEEIKDSKKLAHLKFLDNNVNYNKNYYDNNKEKIEITKKFYNEKNKIDIKKTKKLWYEKNKERIL